MASPETGRRVERVRYELRRREVEVARVETIGDSFARIVFCGEDLADFQSAGFDDHIKFIFEDDNGELVRRDYTPRAFDRDKRELTLEFALHGEGQAGAWARTAKPGQRAVIGGPRGSRIVPIDYDWHLLIADDSGLPAVARRLEELPANANIMVIAVADAAYQTHLASATKVHVQWVEHADALAPAVSRLDLPGGEGFAWGAGEANAMKAVRQVLVEEKQHPTGAMRVAAYWRKGASDFHEELTE